MSWARQGQKRRATTAGFKVIIRPHPQSLKVENDLLDAVQNGLKQYKNVEWDFLTDGTKSMQRAQLLISDTSSVRVDFLFLYEKPIITLEMPFENMQEYEMADLKESWKEKALAELGRCIKPNEVNQIVDIVNQVLQGKQSAALQMFREKNLYNFQRSGEVIAEYLVKNAGF